MDTTSVFVVGMRSISQQEHMQRALVISMHCCLNLINKI